MAEPKHPHDAFLTAQLASLPALPATERLSPSVIRILGHNPGKFTLQGTNTYLLGTGPTRILLDTAAGSPLWHSTLLTVLADEAATVPTCLITHHHGDHTGGIPALLSSSPDTEVYKHTPAPTHLPIADGQVFSVPGATLTAVHTPGHTADHMCFHLAEENAVFTGDTVLGHGTTVFEDLGAYVGSLQRLIGLGAKRAYPAHGAVIEDLGGRVAAYLKHREGREAQVLNVLKKRQERSKLAGLWGGSEGVTAGEVVAEVYRGLEGDLVKAAERGVVQVLEKVKGEGGVRCEEDGEVKRWFVIEKPPRL
ncbi:Metallo-hydrolase/oxidoreductase [Morchella conica CCBAS932]|uniref:Metallo-hydrolase/oxidoreductase n=1 Tax=Morchella conica CCBAS932 TaxID=1392247 RepID=A0A3N4L3H0_9PEZI|nr:Metallo-hydrolase/oxidoreductase [Morchella conica CCBAS932]